MTFFTAKKGAAAAILALLIAFSSTTYGQRDELESVKGSVRGFTEAPKGEVDGMTLSDGTIVHWPPHLQRKFMAVAKKGDRVEVTGRRSILPEGEKVFEARTVTNLTTKESYTNDDEGPPPPPRGKRDQGIKGKAKGKEKERERGNDSERTVTGMVERFTEAPKGEIDGMRLDDGTIVQWPPHLEKHFTAIVEKGDRVRVLGRDERTPEGTRVLEVRSVTNLATKKTRVNEDAPPRGR